MFQYLLATICLAFGFLALRCAQYTPIEGMRSLISSPTEQQTLANRKQVDFEGVTFSYDTSVFGKVESKIVPEYKLQQRDDKPDGVAPECRCFTFKLGAEHQNAVLQVYALDRFPQVYAKNEASVARITIEIDGLKRVIEDEKYRLDGEIPHLPFVDASQDFQSKVKRFPFKNGTGVIFVMHWDIELNLISNRNLIYRYEGITTDGEFYVTAEMPIKAPFLPEEAPDEFEGFRVWDENRYAADALDDKKLSNYRKGISKRLETLPNDQFRPKLKYFEDLISSLSIGKSKRKI